MAPARDGVNMGRYSDNELSDFSAVLDESGDLITYESSSDGSTAELRVVWEEGRTDHDPLDEGDFYVRNAIAHVSSYAFAIGARYGNTSLLPAPRIDDTITINNETWRVVECDFTSSPLIAIHCRIEEARTMGDKNWRRGNR